MKGISASCTGGGLGPSSSEGWGLQYSVEIWVVLLSSQYRQSPSQHWVLRKEELPFLSWCRDETDWSQSRRTTWPFGHPSSRNDELRGMMADGQRQCLQAESVSTPSSTDMCWNQTGLGWQPSGEVSSIPLPGCSLTNETPECGAGPPACG